MYTQKSILVTRGPETGRDRYNKPIYGPDVRKEAPCWYTHRSATEDTTAGEQYVTGYLIQWPPEYLGLVRGSDTVELDIGVFEVIGQPVFQPSGFLVEGYVQANLEEVSG